MTENAHALALYHPIISRDANDRGVPIQLVESMMLVESSGDTHAWNPEPHYRYLVDATTRKPFRKLTADEIRSETPPKDFPNCPGLKSPVDAEWWGQQASWGLLQVMGAVAREYGFRGNFPELCGNPEMGIKYGIALLAFLRNRHLAAHGWEGVVAAYNTGQPDHDDGNGLVYVTKIRHAGGFNFKEHQV